ncbi:hypothetical protein [Burkholderia multivorans]|uniref:hypothetical protein n=1 Tax=Burkholderia multivorans TaxID=87883 RepID=UPI0011B26BEF|nr:hypothetical protein [Burkholderia multivorans]MBY4791651.1 hypothetical protein [Burkholderia multivorans]
MYAFSPVQCDPPPGCYVELTRAPLYGIRLTPRGNRYLRHCQSRLVFDIACETLGVSTPYAIEKRLVGDAFAPDNRSRWWEKLRYKRFDLPRALKRGDPVSRMWMERLAKQTSEASQALAMPIWALSSRGRVTVDAVMSWRTAVEAMGVSIPKFSARSTQSAKRYVDQLCAPLRSPDTVWAGANVALFCLRLAQARGDLANYALTYETIASDTWRFDMMNAGLPADEAWGQLATFYGEWFSTLRLNVGNEADLMEVLEELRAYGLSTELASISRAEDDRYAFVDSLTVDHCPPTTERSIFIFAHYAA